MNPLKSNIGSADKNDPNHHKYIRNLRSTDQLMKQFCKVESSVDKPAYDRGWVWNFEWCSSDPKKARPDLVEFTNHYMTNWGYSFADAFDVAMRARDCEHHYESHECFNGRVCILCAFPEPSDDPRTT